MPAVRQARPVQAVRTALAVLALALAGLLAVIAPVVGQSATPPPQPTIGSVTPAVVKPGAKLIIKGTGFIDVRAVSMAGVSLPYKLKSRKRIEARAPQNAARGPVTVSTRGGAINSPRQVIVKPQVTVAPPSGPIGTEVSVSGSGFIPGEPVDVSLGRVALAATTADSKGEVATSFVVPARTSPGVTTVRMQGRFSGVPSDRLYDVAASWPQRGLSASGNRRSSDTYLGATLSASLLLDWVADLIGPSGSSPAIGSDVVVVGADTGAVLVMPTDCATDGQGCTPRSIGITRGAVRGGPAIASSVAYVTSEDANVYAFDLNCGESEGPCDPLWSYQTGGPITSSPAVDIDVVVVGSSDGNVYGLDLACGLTSEPGAGDDVAGCAPRWISPTGGSISSSPAIHDGVAYVGSDDGYLYAIETDCSTAGGTCEPLWRGWTGGAVRSSPAVANGLVYVGSSDGKVHGFATGCGDGGEVCQAIWRGDADAPIESSPVVADGYVVVGANDGSVMAFPTACADRNKGCAPTWKALTGGAVRSTPAVSGAAQGGSMVFVGSDDGFLYAYPLKCRPAGRPSLCSAIWASGTSAPISASPAIVDGALFVSSEDGTVRRWSLP